MTDPTHARAVARELAKILERDPLFSPLAELTLKVERTLGEGGMGVVHLVTDRRLGRRAALKLVKSSVEDEGTLARFLREARITARLDHPGIPPVYEAGKSVSGEHFMLMRFVDGRSLHAILHSADAPPETTELVGILIKVAEAVAYANSRNIVHRDLKPANIMVGAFGEVLVMDWGLARNLDEAKDTTPRGPDDENAAAGLTQAGSVLGTLGYMPPEQANGTEVDARADVFALGAILVEILTGEPPIVGASHANRLKATLEGKISLPRARRRDVAPELDAIAAHALAVKPEDRYDDAAELAADLKAHLEGRETSVYHYGSLERTTRLVRRNPAVFAVVAFAVLLSAGAALAMRIQNGRLVRLNADLEEKEKKRAAEETLRKNIERAQELMDDASKARRGGATVAEVAKLVADSLAAHESPRLLLEGARQLDKMQQSAEAEKLLRQCADAFPDSYEALFRLANLDQRLGRLATAELSEISRRAKAHGDENEYTATARALGAMQQGDWEAARVAIDAAVAKYPLSADAVSVRVTIREKLGDVEGAARDCDRLIELDRDSANHWIVRGRFRVTHGLEPQGAEDFTKAIELEPREPWAYIQRGFARGDAGDFDLARQDFDRAIELAPENHRAFVSRGMFKRLVKDFAGATADLERALTLAPNAAQAEQTRQQLDLARAGR